MIKFILHRILVALPLLFVIATLCFFMVRLVPGGPFDGEKTLSEETLKALNTYYGFDKSLPEQYVTYLGNICKGDFGPSYKYQGWTVGEIIMQKAPVSLKLGAMALGLALVLGLTVGILCAVFQNRLPDKILGAVSLLGICLPSFVVAPLLILIFAVKFKSFNVFGWNSFSDMILPAISLAIFYFAWIAKLVRSQMIEVLDKAYIRTAKSKGVSAFSLYFKHSLRNASLPLVSYLAPSAAGLLTGSFVVESIFQIPGLGRFFISSALDRDYTMIMACVLLYAFFIICFNILADIIMAILNPRFAQGLGLR